MYGFGRNTIGVKLAFQICPFHPSLRKVKHKVIARIMIAGIRYQSALSV
jgi:hypothetical protein